MLAVFALLVVLFLPIHLAGIDKVVTIDEPWWVISGSNYYYALTHRDFANTIYDYHPAVTTTWVVTAGMLSYFPEYRGFGQGYFDVRKPHFEEFLRDHGREAIELMRNSRWMQTGIILVMLTAGYFLLQLLMGRTAAFLGIVLAMNAPFFLGQSRLLNHEAMLASFVLVSLLGMQVYVNKDRRPAYLLVSGAAFGLAQLTKSSSIVLLPLVGLMLLIDMFKPGGKTVRLRIWGGIRSLAIWILVAGIVFVALWPGMWVAPGRMIYEIYGNAFSYAFQGARLDVTGDLQPSNFDVTLNLVGVRSYAMIWIFLSTTISWLGLILAAVFLVFGRQDRPDKPVRSTVLYLLLQAALFILLFGIARGRDTSHYILTSFVCLDVAAGIGWGYLLMWLRDRWDFLDRLYLKELLALVLAGVQIAYVLPHYPYYFTYKNGLVTSVSAYGYGEGLELAAAYLADKPGAADSRCYVYSGMGTFSFFYPGETDVLKKIYLREQGMPSIIHDLERADYLVLYMAVQANQPESKRLLGILEAVKPEKQIYLNGAEYVRIYKVSEIPASAYEEMSRN
jgi:hypothetical protein